MNRFIFNELNKIRLNEQTRKLNHALALLEKTRKNELHPVQDMLSCELTSLNREIYTAENQRTAFENYDHHQEILRLLVRKSRKFEAEIQTILGILWNTKKSRLDHGIYSFSKLIYKIFKPKSAEPMAELQSSVKLIKKELKDLNLQIKTLLPLQFAIMPADPFFFITGDNEPDKDMISIIVVSDAEDSCLAKLLDSFLKVNSYKKYEILVVDRKSKGNSTGITGKYQDKLFIKALKYEQDFTGSYLKNLAADTCRGEFLLFLDPCLTLKNDILPLFHNHFNNDASTGIAGASVDITGKEGIAEKDVRYGKIGFSFDEIHGQPDIINPSIDHEFITGNSIEISIRDYRKKKGVMTMPGTTMPCLKPVLVKSKAGSGTEEVPAVWGGALFCRRADFIRAGGFDLNYINGYEDIDLCLKYGSVPGKKSVLVKNIEVKADAGVLRLGPDPADESIGRYNLGILINKHGLLIKNRYIGDLADKEKNWTEDRIEMLKDSFMLDGFLPSEKGDQPDGMDKQGSADNILSGYISGYLEKKLRISIKIPAFNNESLQFWGDYHFGNSLKKAFVKKGYPARIDTFESWYEKGYLEDDVVVVLRGIKDYKPRGAQVNILWNISHPDLLDREEFASYDHVFAASEVFARELREKFGINAEGMLQCTDHELFYPDFEVKKEEEKTDILYVANSRGVMRKSMEFVLQKNIPVTVYGTNWEKFLPPGMIKGTFIKNDELRRFYSNCNILLNDHWPDMAESGFISNRIFDALACGAVLLTDPVQGLESVFGEGIYFYKDADELEEQIAWIRGHFDEAKQLAMQNSARVLANHTFDQRAERILEVALQIHRLKT